MQPNYWKIGVILLSLIIFGGVLFLLLSGRSSPFQTQPSIANTELTGEMFVVTQGSGNVKIGLAEIVLENQATRQNYKTTTNADGKFSLIVPLGSYSLDASATRPYQMQLSGDLDYKERLDERSIDKSFARPYKAYHMQIDTKIIQKSLLHEKFVQIEEFYSWKILLNLNQSKQSLQLSNNNLTNYGLKE